MSERHRAKVVPIPQSCRELGLEVMLGSGDVDVNLLTVISLHRGSTQVTQMTRVHTLEGYEDALKAGG